MMTNNDLLTVKEVLKYLRISRTSLYRLIKEQDFPCIKLGGKLLFRKHEIDKYLETKKVK